MKCGRVYRSEGKTSLRYTLPFYDNFRAHFDFLIAAKFFTIKVFGVNAEMFRNMRIIVVSYKKYYRKLEYSDV